MSEIILSDYFYGDETTAHFTFFKIPCQLITALCFKRLSSEAKLLYGILLDRMGLSARNGWHDDAGRVYVYYTIKKICENIGCGRNKAMRLLAELDTVKGIGLIERVKQGQGRPDKIFVKRIAAQEDSEKSNSANPNPTAPVSEDDFSNVQKSENPTSRGSENRPQEVSKTDANETNKNQTEFTQINPSILLRDLAGLERIDQCEQRKVNTDFVRWAVYALLPYRIFSTRTSCSQTDPPGYSVPDSTVYGAV